ncbi:MAG: gamma carbonic anhydrase family protein, partial [Candidatus Dormibacteria bacterium]
MNRYVTIAIVVAAIISAFVIGQNFATTAQPISQSTMPWPNIHQTVMTGFNGEIKSPQIDNSSFIHPFAVVIGDCHIGKNVFMGPTAVCRGDEGTPIYIGDNSNVQDGV